VSLEKHNEALVVFASSNVYFPLGLLDRRELLGIWINTLDSLATKQEMDAVPAFCAASSTVSKSSSLVTRYFEFDSVSCYKSTLVGTRIKQQQPYQDLGIFSLLLYYNILARWLHLLNGQGVDLSLHESQVGIMVY
jgi:hypothetical protein